MNKKLLALLIARGLKADATDQEAIDYMKANNITVVDASGDNPTLQASGAPAPVVTPAVTPAPAPVMQAASAATIAAMREDVSGEEKRINAIRALPGKGTVKANGQDVDIKAHAIAQGWSPAETELAILRAERTAPAVIVAGQPNLSRELIHASALMGVGHLTGQNEDTLIRAGFSAPVVEAAARRKFVRISQLMRACCANEGVHIPHDATQAELLQAAFSTTSFSGILGNILRKAIDYKFSIYPGVEDVRRLTRKETVIDFKTKKWYRLATGGGLSKLTPEGNLKLDYLKDSENGLTIDTKGKQVGIDRKTLINDDLGVLVDMPSLMTQDAAMQFIADFWALIIANAGNFFSEDHKNLDTTGAIVGPDGYDLMCKMLADMEYSGMPLMLSPRYVVVGTGNAAAAKRMAKDTQTMVMNRMSGSAVTTTTGPSVNIYTGLEPVVSPWLRGEAAGDFYGFADPQFATAVRAGYLNGVEAPTVEEVTDRLDATFLGRAWNIVFDYGFDFADFQGAVKMTSAEQLGAKKAKK
ncbi:MAG: hypothetical protein WCV67_03075 [Victivallaceae bacterium]|jgi:hypothetical protein